MEIAVVKIDVKANKGDVYFPGNVIGATSWHYPEGATEEKILHDLKKEGYKEDYATRTSEYTIRLFLKGA